MASRPGARGRVCLACVLAVQLAPALAQADPTPADKETARTLMQQGREQRAKGNVKEALRRFRGADDIMHVPTTGLEVARAEVDLGLLVEARDAIAAIRLTPVRPGDPVQFKEARAKADELDKSINGRIPALTITVKDTPAGETASVTIDGAAIPAGVLGLPRTVDAGHHVIVAKTAHGEGKVEVDVREGDQKPVDVPLVITAAPEAVEPSPPPPEGETPPPPTRSHSPTALTWTGIGLVVAGVATGSAFGALSLSKTSSLKGQCTNGICGPSLYTQYDQASTDSTIATIGFIAAGAGAAVVLVTLLVGHGAPSAPPPARGQVLVHPWLGLGAGGVGGTF
jgi:hypothetical protein